MKHNYKVEYQFAGILYSNGSVVVSAKSKEDAKELAKKTFGKLNFNIEITGVIKL